VLTKDKILFGDNYMKNGLICMLAIFFLKYALRDKIDLYVCRNKMNFWMSEIGIDLIRTLKLRSILCQEIKYLSLSLGGFLRFKSCHE